MSSPMTAPVERLVAQNIEIYDALRDTGLPAEFITNPYGEQLAVVSRGVFDPCRVASSLVLRHAFEQREYSAPLGIDAVAHAFPISGNKVYPKEYTDIFDLVTSIAARRDGLATAFKSPTSSDEQATTKRGGGLGLHSDYVGSNSYDQVGLPLLGLNEHATRWGSYAVRLGVLRELEYDGLIADIRRQVGDSHDGRRAVRDAYVQYAGPYTEPVELGAGDMLFFQAQQHAERGLPGTAHDFVTTSETRRSDVFRPTLGDTAQIQAQRDMLAEHYQLADFGY